MYGVTFLVNTKFCSLSGIISRYCVLLRQLQNLRDREDSFCSSALLRESKIWNAENIIIKQNLPDLKIEIITLSVFNSTKRLSEVIWNPRENKSYRDENVTYLINLNRK